MLTLVVSAGSRNMVRDRADDLTRRQREVIHAILEYQLAHEGRSPSLRELRDALGVGSTATVSAHLGNLERKGYISVEPFQARSIRLI